MSEGIGGADDSDGPARSESPGLGEGRRDDLKDQPLEVGVVLALIDQHQVRLLAEEGFEVLLVEAAEDDPRLVREPDRQVAVVLPEPRHAGVLASVVPLDPSVADPEAVVPDLRGAQDGGDAVLRVVPADLPDPGQRLVDDQDQRSRVLQTLSDRQPVAREVLAALSGAEGGHELGLVVVESQLLGEQIVTEPLQGPLDVTVEVVGRGWVQPGLKLG